MSQPPEVQSGSRVPPRSAVERLGDAIREGAWAVGGLLLLATIGIGVTSFSARYGYWYWVAMLPLFGLTSLLAALSRARAHGRPVAPEVRSQLLHWVGALMALEIVYLLQTRGRISGDAGGLTALLVLSLATFLAGVHADWRFALMGILLGAATAGAALVEQFLWMGVIPVVGGIILLVYLMRRSSTP